MTVRKIIMNIEKAKESLQAAELCYAHKLYNSTTNRAYYAMFQAAVVALEVGGLKAVGARWSHAKVQSTFAARLTRQRKNLYNFLVCNLPNGWEYATKQIMKPPIFPKNKQIKCYVGPATS